MIFYRGHFFNVIAQLRFHRIIAMGHDRGHHHRGIDLSVRSVVGLSGIVTGLVLNAGHSLVGGNAPAC